MKLQIPVRFAASKIIEGDRLIEEKLKLTQNEKETIEHIILQMEAERGLDRAAAIADMRFSFIFDLCSKTVVNQRKAKNIGEAGKSISFSRESIPQFLCL